MNRNYYDSHIVGQGTFVPVQEYEDRQMTEEEIAVAEAWAQEIIARNDAWLQFLIDQESPNVE